MVDLLKGSFFLNSGLSTQPDFLRDKMCGVECVALYVRVFMDVCMCMSVIVPVTICISVSIYAEEVGSGLFVCLLFLPSARHSCYSIV